MTLEEAQRRLVARMSESERAAFDQGCRLVDFYMDIATDASMPATTRAMAREVLRACATRQPEQTVMDIVGQAKQ